MNQSVTMNPSVTTNPSLRSLIRRSMLGHCSLRSWPFIIMACASLLAVLTPLGGFGATYYISTAGNDANSGTTTNSAWRNISKANSTLVAGDRVEIRAGTYDDLIQPANSGTSENTRITYTSFNGEAVLIRGKNIATALGAAARVSNNFITISNLQLNGDKWTGSEPLGYMSVNAASSQNFRLLNCAVIKAGYTNAANFDKKPGGVTLGENATDAVVENCVVVGWYIGIAAGQSQRVTLRNNVVQNNSHHQIVASTDGPIPDLKLLVEGNHIGGSMTSDGFQAGVLTNNVFYNNKIIIRSNYFYYNGEDHIDLKGAGDVLIEGNVLVAAFGDNDGYMYPKNGSTTWDGVSRYGGSVNHGSGAAANPRVIVRKNVFYDNNRGWQAMEDDWKCYNNTFVANNRDFLQGWNSSYDGNDDGNTNTTTDIVCHLAAFAMNKQRADFINNISMDHRIGEIQRTTSAATMKLDHNLYHNSTPSGLRFLRNDDVSNNRRLNQHTIYTTLAAWRTYLNTQANVQGREANSLVADPQFVSVPAYPNLFFNFKRADPVVPTFLPVIALADRAAWFPHDFRLASGSPAIDAGAFLTTTTSAGSGTVVPVEDAGYFTDGFGTVPGDTIQIGASVVQVTAINYATKTLTVSPSISWTNGTGVSLPYAGSKPDIGAFEYTENVGETSAPPAAPSSLIATLVGSNQINLAWVDNSTNETQFRFERKIGNGSYSLLANVGAIAGSGGTGAYSDTNLNPGTTYTYQVRAETGTTNSLWSNEAATNTPNAGGGGGGLTNLYEAELLAATGSPANAISAFGEGGASGGTNSLFTATNLGNFITYTVNVPVAGSYNLRAGLNKYTSRGKCNLYVDGSGTPTGTEMDLYNASGYAYEEVNQGEVTFTNAGNHTFRFQVSGKNASSTGYKLSFDYLKLIGSSAVPLPPPVIMGAAVSNNNFVVTFSTEAGGLYEVQRADTLTPPAWTSIVTNLPGTGGTIQIADTSGINQLQRFYRVKLAAP
jgi:hypothetical protein